MNAPTTLVLGAAIGYSEAQIAPFLSTLRNSGYTGDVALLVDPVTARSARHNPLFAGVDLVATTQWFPYRPYVKQSRWLPRIWRRMQKLMWLGVRALAHAPLPASARRSAQLALAQRVCPPTLSRYFHYARYLRGRQHDRVLLSDVRDVIFQSDPFPALPTAGLAASMESRTYSVGTERHNAMWVRLAFGPAMLDAIGNNQVSCSGVTYGDRAAIGRYVEGMVSTMLALPLEAAGLGGVDQGVHNVLLWTGRLGAFHRLETMAGPVATLSGVDDEALQLSAQGQVLNRDGSLPCVLHQYDRSARLRAHFGVPPR